MLNWLMDHVFDREGARLWKEECARFDENSRMIDDLDKRVRASFTPQDWAEVSARCEHRLAEIMGN